MWIDSNIQWKIRKGILESRPSRPIRDRVCESGETRKKHNDALSVLVPRRRGDAGDPHIPQDVILFLYM